MGRSRVGVVTAMIVGALGLPAAAQAAEPPLGLTCTPQNGVRFCPGNGTTERFKSFDGVPLDVDVTLPPSGDGPFPTIVMLHGYGGNKGAFETTSEDPSTTAASVKYRCAAVMAGPSVSTLAELAVMSLRCKTSQIITWLTN